MQSALNTTYTDIAKTLTGLAAKPAKKTSGRPQRVMELAWKKYRAKQAENLKDMAYAKANLPADRFEKWLKNQTGFNAKLFGHALQDAHRAVFLDRNAHLFTVTSDEARVIGSDSRWR